jgi:ABC-type Zn uptake system ZnuABC Zn-binding protein ZnuA
VSSDAFTPAGFVPLANWDNRHRGNNDGHSVEWKLLSDAAKAGKVPGMKLGGSGRWIVHEHAAVEYLAKIRAEATPAKEPSKSQAKRLATQYSDGQFEAALVSLTRIDNGLALIHATLERLATAVESVAKQPRKDEFAEFTQN